MFERIMYSGLWFIILAIIGVGGWYAYKNLNHEFIYESDQVNQSDEVDINYDDVIESQTEPVITTEGDKEPDIDIEAQESPIPPVTTNQETSTEHAGLVSELNRLITDNINMKIGSRGTRVGTVQEFLNIFLEQQSTTDNDFGPGTERRVIQFQEEMDIAADGEPGPQTYQAMIDWLNAQ